MDKWDNLLRAEGTTWRKMLRHRKNEQKYYDTLRKIAREYQTAEQLRRRAGQYGLGFVEEIELCYENLQDEARRAIRGKRRPKSA